MTFKVAARTILQLGSELISSDSIAFNELIKNGFDAGSSRVEIEFLIRVPGDRWDDCHAVLYGGEGEDFTEGPTEIESIREMLLAGVDRSAPKSAGLIECIQLASTVEDLRKTFQEANTITVRDSGSGMSLSILADAFLTIGTRFRRVEREKARAGSSARAILGDKGVGRLSVMRLGSQLLVKTTQAGESSWHELRIDWGIFSHDSDVLLSEIPIGPTEGSDKYDRNSSGTELLIWGLAHSWTIGRVEEIVRSEFARFMDPFASRRYTSVRVTFNSRRISIPRFDRLLFDNAHATLNVKFNAQGSESDAEAPTLAGNIDYRTASQKTEFRLGPLGNI